MGRPRKLELVGVQRAFDKVRFGTDRTLNLRQGLPTGDQAVARAESWLRQRQAEGITEVLVITGRGNNSPARMGIVRERIAALLPSLRRRGVVERVEEHTPGSFVVTLAPLASLVDAPRRRREKPEPPPPRIPNLGDLDPETVILLRDLSERALEGLGVGDTGRFLHDEMLKQFSAIVVSVPQGPDFEKRLRRALKIARDQYE